MLVKLIKAMPLPHAARNLARFVYRLPIYWRYERSNRICNANALSGSAIAISDQIIIYCPDDAIAGNVFRRMAFERANFSELKSFIELSNDCTNFVDVGASGGFFSAVFAAANSEHLCQILSIEMDRYSIPILTQVCERNSRSNTRWLIDGRGVSSEAAIATVATSGYGAEVLDDVARERTKRWANVNQREYKEYEVEFETLEKICADNEIIPDLIKIDIEGFEFELFEGSADFIRTHHPKLSLELHISKLHERGKSPDRIVQFLDDCEYRIFPSGDRAREILSLGNEIGVAHACFAHESDLS